MNIKTVVIILLIIVSLALFITLLASSYVNKSNSTLPTPVQMFSPSPSASSVPSSAFPRELESERIKQEDYAKKRASYLQTRPWLPKLPLQSNNYFISYNASDIFIVELYYSENSNLTKEQQLTQAKQAALNAMQDAGIDVSKQQIQYLELVKKQ